MRAIFGLLIVCLIATIADSALELVAAEDKKVDERTFMLDFPDVKGWSREPPKTYDDPRLGYSVGYRADENGPAYVTIYFYTRGVETIPDNLTAKVVQAEIEEAKANVHQAVQAGVYDDAREEESGTRILGGRTKGASSLYARFRITAKNNATRSELYVLPYKNNFFKVRLTQLSDMPDGFKEDLDRLFDALNALVAKK